MSLDVMSLEFLQRLNHTVANRIEVGGNSRFSNVAIPTNNRLANHPVRTFYG